MLKTTRPQAMQTPAAATAVTQAKSGRDTVLSSRLTTVRSCGTLTPAKNVQISLHIYDCWDSKA